jgi:hypothetical protein
MANNGMQATAGAGPRGRQTTSTLALIEEHEDEIRVTWRRHFPG